MNKIFVSFKVWKIMLLIRCFYSLLLLFGAPALAEELPLLFVLFDAGESNALIPIMEKCDEEGIEYRALLLGTARTLVHSKKRIELSDLGIDENVDAKWPRNKELKQEEIEKIQQALSPKLLVTGVSSAIQGQLLIAYRQRATTAAYWDNFSPSGSGDYFETAQRVQALATFLLVPSKLVRESPTFKPRDLAHIVLVGQPSLDRWKERFCTIDKAAVLKRLGLGSYRGPIITYIGGYGADYEKAFGLFMRCVEKEKAKILIQPHPKYKGAFEEAQPLCPHCLISKNIAADEAVSIADLVVSYNSTVGFQALSVGKKVLFVVPEDDPYTNLAIDLKLAQKVATPAQFRWAVATLNKKEKGAVTFAASMGIPEESCPLFMRFIRGYLTPSH
jgi:hypothetical protein